MRRSRELFSIAIALTITLWLSGVAHVMPARALTPPLYVLNDGDVVRVKDAPGLAKLDVYIIKVTPKGKYKRLVLNPQVFESYGHLRWDKVREINQWELDPYQLSEVVITANEKGEIIDPKVYKLVPDEDTGTKRHLDVTPQQFKGLGHSFDEIYKVNSVDIGNYALGDPISANRCTMRSVPWEEIFGKTLTISADKKSVLLNGTAAISINELPTTIIVHTESSFQVTNQEFTSAVLDPTEKIIAFTVDGGVHGWGGFKNIASGRLYPVAFQFEGSVSNPKWNHNGSFAAFSKRTAKPADVIALVQVVAPEDKPFTSAHEQVLDFEALNPFPAGILSDLRDHYWSQDRDSNLYFSVVVTDTAQGSTHTERWYYEAAPGIPPAFILPNFKKWKFLCTQD